MARADSTVRVNIVGDARDLQRASKDSQKAVGGIGKAAKTAGGIIAAAFAVDAVLDFGQTALAEADRVGDATGRLEEQLGDLAQPLIDTAEGFEDLGQSRQDILELEAAFSDIATALGLADDQIAPFAVSAAETAAALSLITDMDAATIIDQIGKASTGGAKALKALGISLTDAEIEARALKDTGKKNAESLTDGELAAAGMALVLEKLAPRVSSVTDAEADLETRQKTLQAKFETLTGKIGDAVDGPLNDLLTWVLNGIDGIETLADGLANLGKDFDKIVGKGGAFLDFLRALFRRLSAISPLLGILGAAVNAGPLSGSRSGPVSGSPGAPHPGVVVQVNGGSPAVIEQAVRDAVDASNSHGPRRG